MDIELESKINTSDFSFYQNAWLKKNHLSQSFKIRKDDANALMKEKGLYVRNIYNWDKGTESSFWFVIKDSFGGMDELPTKVRNQVRKSLKTYDFRIVSYETIRETGLELFNKSRERFGGSELLFNERQWIERLNRDEKNDFWIGYDKETGKPASFAMNAIYDDYVDICTMGISPEFPNNTYPMYGLIYEISRYYLEERKVPFVCDGARSITGHSNIQTVLEDKFKFRKAYCDVQVFYKSWLGVAVKLLYPVRHLIKNKKISALLNQEAMARGRM